MKCHYCSFADCKVIDSRPTDEGFRIRRRRECPQCGQRFTTYEMMENLPLIVVKKDKSRESYDRNKLLSGMLRACEKRPVPLVTLEKSADDIERTLDNSMEREVRSEYIGELVMEKLALIDEVAYIRFASVYRHFKDISGFLEEINRLASAESEA